MVPESNYFSGALIARAARTYKRALRRRALRERWPSRRRGNCIEFTPPRSLISKCRALAAKAAPTGLHAFRFTDSMRAEIVRVLLRLQAVLELFRRIETGEPYEKSLLWVSRTFNCSAASLRRWQRAFSVRGIAGLEERERGVVGRKKGTAR